VPDSGNSVPWYNYYLTTDPTFGGSHRQTKWYMSWFKQEM
jgi:hypothetical protein